METLEMIQNALLKPHWQLFLGRKAFVPNVPVYFREGVLTSEKPLESFLRSVEFDEILKKYRDEFGIFNKFGETTRRRLIVEDEQGSETRQDVPLSLAARRFTNRRVRTDFIELKNGGQNDGNTPDENDLESELAQGLG